MDGLTDKWMDKFDVCMDVWMGDLVDGCNKWAGKTAGRKMG